MNLAGGTTADGGDLANVLASDAAPKSEPVILTLISGGYRVVIELLFLSRQRDHISTNHLNRDGRFA